MQSLGNWRAFPWQMENECARFQLSLFGFEKNFARVSCYHAISFPNGIRPRESSTHCESCTWMWVGAPTDDREDLVPNFICSLSSQSGSFRVSKIEKIMWL